MDIKELLISKISLIPKELVPAVSAGLIVVAFALILVFFVMCVAYISMKPKPVLKRNDLKAEKKDALPEKVRHEDLPLLSGRTGEILTLSGILNAGPITKIFFKVLEIMKNSTYDVRWRYKLPCFMMVGTDESGKTSLLDSLNFEHLPSEESSVNSMWKLFKNGVVFEMPRIDSSENINKFWSFIGELFVFIRPRRPLDGIIITLPADRLLSESFDAEKHSREIFEKIFKFQHLVNFHLPIYLIVTKADFIQGFSEFSHLLADSAKQQMFGWSCPYSTGTAFSSAWIDEIFRTVNDGIRKAVLNFSKENELTPNLENAILFEYNFQKIKSSLTKYLYSMFQTHSPEEGLILRGVYFTGQQKRADITAADIIRPAALSPNMNFAFGHSYCDNLYFVQDLFREKIFKEFNIAYPIRVDSIDMNKTEQRNKIIMATTSAVIALGWFWGNGKIKEKIHEYYLGMASVKTMVTKIKYLEANLKGEEDQALINKETVSLLKNMPSVKKSDLVSVFVPQSWFSNLYKEIIETVGLVFDSVIVRAMYIDINLDTRKILQNFLKDMEGGERKKDLFDVNSFASFKKLKEFVKKVCDIEKVSATYNSVRRLEDRKSVADLTSRLFKENFSIADEIKDRIPNKKLIPPKFDITLFREKIESNLKEIHASFLKDTLDVLVEKILQNLSNDIEKIIDVSQNAAAGYSVTELAKVYNKTILVSDIIKNKNFSWISSGHFSPCNEYEKIMNDLGASDIINNNCVKELIKTGELEFHKFKSRLLGYKTDLTGTLLSSDIQTTSIGFNNFQDEIKSVLEQPFICVTPKGKLSTVILEDKMLIWDLKRLKDLSGLIDKYYDFSENIPTGMRAQFFDMYKTVARKCFYPIINSMLGSSQIFDDVPMGHSAGLLEDAYKRQAINIRGASFALPKIAKIIEEMEEEDNAKDCGFSSMLISQYSSLLEKIDALFNQEKPYSAEHAAFDGWDGDTNPAYLNINSKEELKKYLTAQFERIRFLAKDLASPIVDLLSLPIFAEKVKNRNIVMKWKEIIAGVDDYESKKPGNSISALESFISESLSKVSIGSFDEQGEIKVVSETDGDYFLSKRSDVAKSLLSRADIVQYEKAAGTYTKIQKFFNDYLAHKFPFGESKTDASLSDIENFIRLYEQNLKNAPEILGRNQQRKNINEKALEFLETMNTKLIPFLKNWIAHSKTSDINDALITFGVQTRPSPDAEVLTSSVMDRELKIDNVQIVENTNGLFYNGNKVEMIFAWVSSSDEKPNEKGAVGNMLIEGAKVTFSYGGKWAMLRLIEENKVNKEAEAPNGVLLQFNVPIVDASKGNAELTSKMIVKITPTAKDGDKTSPLTWPVFPESCPDLHKKYEEIGEKPEIPAL
ncbi:MAG: hypothetical protein LBJ96_02035 [Holosporaceae bacterium]|jgi:type VI secretion system protein ImpL|nr:hypothetical protein [Holosporaceae bacterium]